MSFGFAPKGWAMCNGQLLPINQNQALFSLLGTTFGGDGRVTFALPDLRARTPIHVGNGHSLGEMGGEQTHTLSTAELPAHTHVAGASSISAAGNDDPTNRVLGSVNNMFHAPASLTAMRAGTIANTGASQAHQNMQPFLTLTFCIALQGIFPSPS
jgi:microcystin-dependent protein